MYSGDVVRRCCTVIVHAYVVRTYQSMNHIQDHGCYKLCRNDMDHLH
jgi:hypothetical protein